MTNSIKTITQHELLIWAQSDIQSLRSLAAEVLTLRARDDPTEPLHSERVDILVRPDGWPHHPLDNIGAIVQEIYDNIELQRLSIEMAGFRVVGYPKTGKTIADATAAVCRAVERKDA